MFRFLRRALARPETIAGPEHAAPGATVLRFPAQDSPGDVVMANGLWAPVQGATLPGAGYSFVTPWPLADDRSAEIAMGIVMPPEEIARVVAGA